MQIIHHEKPELKLPVFTVDDKLSPHLDDDVLLSHMNKRFICGLIGKAGSGKSSLLLGLLSTSKKFKKVFNQVFVFMPKTSMGSIKNCVYDELPDEQKFEGVTFDNLQEVYTILKKNKEDKKLSLLIFDDVQSYLKTKEVETALLHIIANSRHLRTSIFICAQNYNKVPKNIRISFTDLFLFNVGKTEYKNIYEENVEVDDHEFEDILKLYRKYKESDIYSFIYIHEKTTFFINWNSVVL
jgi:ABC-type dipeptide/oligopeptide/nickel transport system ATPase component